ncbi:MAG TPA: hypothetical protein VIZ43_14415, partial [Trebonia sp.]
GSSWKVSADVVIRVRGTNGAQRWVTGTVYLRMLTDDILGHGLITTEASPQRGNYDLRSVLKAVGRIADWRHQHPDTTSDVAKHIRDHAARPDQATGDYAGASSRGLRLWLDRHGQREGTAANAMFLAAATARESGRPVELVLRDGNDTRRLRLGPDGRPVPSREAAISDRNALAAAWDRLHTTLERRVAAQDAIPRLTERAAQVRTALSALTEEVKSRRQLLDAHQSSNDEIHARVRRLRAEEERAADDARAGGEAHEGALGPSDAAAARAGRLERLRDELHRAEEAAKADDLALEQERNLFRDYQAFLDTTTGYLAHAEQELATAHRAVESVTAEVAGRLGDEVTSAVGATLSTPGARRSTARPARRLHVEPVLVDHTFELADLLNDIGLTDRARQAAGNLVGTVEEQAPAVEEIGVIGRSLAERIRVVVTAERPLARTQLIIRGSVDDALWKFDTSLAQSIANGLPKRVIFYKHPLNLPIQICP